MFASRQIGIMLIGGTLVLLALIATGFVEIAHERKSGQSTQLPVISTLPAFVLTNQLQQRVTLDDLKGQVWIADIIFTRCAGPCPRMTRQMSELQPLLAPHAEVRLITLTTDPQYDTPAVLQQYGERFGAKPGQWWFLTGPKSEIAKVATNGLKLTALEKTPADRDDAADLFIHSTIFVVVDRHGRMRAAVETQDNAPVEEGQLPPSGPSIWEREAKPALLKIVNQLLAEK